MFNRFFSLTYTVISFLLCFMPFQMGKSQMELSQFKPPALLRHSELYMITLLSPRDL